MKTECISNARSILVLLVFSNKILHVRLGFGELDDSVRILLVKVFQSSYLHLVHTLLSVPMQEGLALEHSSELVVHTLEEFLDRRRVTTESDSHLKTARCNIALRGEDIVRDPLDEVR